MQIPDEIFKAYDIRGKFPEQFSSNAILEIGKAMGSLFGENQVIVIGCDVRLSSPLIKYVISAGLMESGCSIIDIGVCTTPTIYFLAAKNSEVNGGVMITASHNPIDYNGIKACDGEGVAYNLNNFFSSVKKIVKQKKEDYTEYTKYGHPIISERINTAQYWSFQKDHFQPRRPLNIAVDIGNGTCYPITNLLKSKGMTVYSLHSEPNGLFPVMIPDPAKPSCLRFLQSEINENEIDIGIGFDADGDRVGFVDNQGHIIRPDKIIMLFGKYLIEKEPNSTILIDVKTSRATYEYLASIGAIVKFTRVGHSWIHEAVLNSGAVFAGELSGHYYFGAGYYGFDDAVYSALKMLELLSSQEMSFAKIVQELPNYPASEELRIPCDESKRSIVVSNIKKRLSEEAVDSITIDGIRAEFKDGWVLVRESGTEPLISIRAEATTLNRLEYYQKYVRELVANEINKTK